MSVYSLTHWDLIAAALLVVLLGIASIWLQLGLQAGIEGAAVKMQLKFYLILVGLV